MASAEGFEDLFIFKNIIDKVKKKFNAANNNKLQKLQKNNNSNFNYINLIF